MASGPIDLENTSSLVLCFDPELPQAAELRNAKHARIVAERHVPLPGSEEAERLTWAELRARPKGSLNVERLVVHTLRHATPWGLAAGLRHCSPNALCVLVDSHGSWFVTNRRGALALAVGRGLRRVFGKTPLAQLSARYLRYTVDPPWPNLEDTLGAADRIVDLARSLTPRPLRSPSKIVHYIGGLGPGGAERQLALLAKRQRARGLDVEVWSTYPLEGSDAHYAPDLQAAGIPTRALPMPAQTLALDPRQIPGLALIRDHLDSRALCAAILQLQQTQPDVLHCWLDGPNVVGGLAGLLTGVPRIVVSTRNVSPKHFPRFFCPWFRGSYRALSRMPQVTFVANSRAGADDYADWLDLPPETFSVVYNGFEPADFTPPAAGERQAQRESLGVDSEAFLVVGVFRLAAEKRPVDFVRVVARLRELVPGVRVMHLGVGDLAEEARTEADRLGLADTLTFCGRVNDPWRYLHAADATVLVSENEGCPNVSLESQALGVPIVATRVGGTAETLVDEETGFLCDLGDVEQISRRLAQLAQDPSLRARMGQAGSELIASRFGVQRMVDESLALYTDPTASDRVR